MTRNGKRERKMKTDGGWMVEREVKWVVGVSGAGQGQGQGQEQGRGKGKGGRRREVEVSSGSVVAAPWLRSDVRVRLPDDSRVLLLRPVCFVLSRFVAFCRVSSRSVSFRLVPSRSSLVHPLLPPPLASDQALGSSTSRAIHTASV